MKGEGNVMFEKKHKQETIKLISFKLRGRKVWNKGLHYKRKKL